MEDKAFEALYAAADTIRHLGGITTVSVDNDHKSGELLFTTATGQEYMLRLVEVEPEVES